MKEKIKEFKESLTDIIFINKKEYLLTLAVCTLAGLLLGIIFSPKGDTTLGSFNGNNNNGSIDGDQDEDEENDD